MTQEEGGFTIIGVEAMGSVADPPLTPGA